MMEINRTKRAGSRDRDDGRMPYMTGRSRAGHVVAKSESPNRATEPMEGQGSCSGRVQGIF